MQVRALVVLVLMIAAVIAILVMFALTIINKASAQEGPLFCGTDKSIVGQISRFETFQTETTFFGRPLWYFKNEATGTWSLVWNPEPGVACIFKMGRDKRPVI